MSDPQAIQAAALAAVDRLIEALGEATRIGRAHSNPHQSTPFCAYCDKRWPCEPRRLADLIVPALAQLEGRRRILRRHRPKIHEALPYRPAWAQCEHCASLCHSFSGVNCDYDGDAPWPCPDWRDAAAGLPLEGADHD